MNIEVIKAACVELVLLVERMNTLVTTLEQRASVVVSGPAEPVTGDVTQQIRALYPQMAAPEENVPPPAKLGRGRRKTAPVWEWIAGRDAPFRVQDVPSHLRPEDSGKATKLMNNLVFWGGLKRVGWGVYQRVDAPEMPVPPKVAKNKVVPVAQPPAGATEAAAPPAVRPTATATPVPVVKAMPPAGNKAPAASVSNAQESPFGAVAIAIGRAFPGSFTMLDLSARLDGRQPQASQFLGAWRARGWIVQAGFGLFKTTPKFGQ